MPHVVSAKDKDLRTSSAEVKKAIPDGPVTIRDASHVHGLCAGLSSGEITIEGDAGDYLGSLNAGATIRVKGNTGRYLADNMNRGTVVVDGSAGYGVAQYCYGGTVVVRGNAGDFSGTMNKGATILVAGNVGDEVATYMLAGDLVILGNAGKNLGNFLIRGSIYVAGDWVSLGHNTRLEDLAVEDIAKLSGYLREHRLSADPAGFKKIVRLSEKPFYKSAPAKALKP